MEEYRESPPESGPGDARKGRRKPASRLKTARKMEQDEIQAAQFAGAGRVLAACPMSAEELAEHWAIGADDIESVMVKVLRQRMGTQEQELMDSVPLVEYDGQRIAGNFGPGTYYLRPGGKKYARNAAKLPVSDSLARSCGYGRIPATAADIVAERTIRQATEGPSDPADLLAAIERILDRREAEKARSAGLQTVGSVDPLAAMRNQFEQIQSMMTFMGSLEERAIKTVEMRMGRAEFPAETADTNTSLLEKLLPKAMDLFGQFMANRQPAPTIPIGQIQTPQPVPIPQQQETPMPNPLPPLTQEEQQAIGGAVAMLRPFAGQLVEMAKRTQNDSEIIAELEQFVPGGLVPSLGALSDVVKAHGPDVLRAIHPGLASERWAAILAGLVVALEGGE